MSSRRIALGNNPGRSRSHNRRVVLEAVRVFGPIGRTDIARLAGITAQAVSNIVEELLSERLLIAQERRRSGRGQPPILFAVNPDGGMTLGVEIAARHVTFVEVDLGGRVRGEHRSELTDSAPASVVPLIGRELRALRQRHGQDGAACLGVGVVMPGPFGVDGMTSVGPTTLTGWTGLDAASLIEAELGVPVFLENDATAAAVGERLFGAARDLRNFALIYFGQGLGLGLVVDGRPYRGAFGNAGEIGHVVGRPGGRPCSCGARGCLEQYASLQSLQERLTAAGIAECGLDGIARLHAAGHPELRGWIDEAADVLRPHLAMLENLMDPETIILGGMLPDGLTAALIAALEPLPQSVARHRAHALPRLMAGTTGRLTAALGAAALPLMETMTPRLDRATP